MTAQELLEVDYGSEVIVTGGDYTYEGWVVSVFAKRKSRAIRCVVEDSCGRLFIHNARQINLK